MLFLLVGKTTWGKTVAEVLSTARNRRPRAVQKAEGAKIKMNLTQERFRIFNLHGRESSKANEVINIAKM